MSEIDYNLSIVCSKAAVMVHNMRFILPIYGLINTGKHRGKPITVNVYRNAHYSVQAKAKKNFHAHLIKQLKGVNPISGKIKCKFVYYAKRHGSDLDNFTSIAKKFFLDCLQSHGIIENDNTDFVVETIEKFGGIDKVHPRVEVELTPVHDMRNSYP